MEPVPVPVPAPAPPVAPLVLQYDTGRSHRRRLDVALFLPATLAGAVAFFLPFTWGVSPFAVVLGAPELLQPGMAPGDWIYLLVAAPFLLPSLLLPYRLRVLLVGPASGVERMLAYGAAGLFAAAVVACVGLIARAAAGRHEYVVTAVGAGMLLVVAFLCALYFRRGSDRDKAAMAALLAPFVANSAIVLVAFPDDRDAGWYVTVAAAGAGLAEMILLAAGARQPR